MKTIGIIGSGFSSLAAACYLAQAGNKVVVYEKNEHLGGRARQWIKDGFTFDIGPTWYWMPDVFERFFNDFNKSPQDYYHLKRLSPSYKVFFENNYSIDIPDNINDIYALFEKEEKGSSAQLKAFLKSAEYNYDVAIKELVYKPGLSPLELITPKTATKLTQFLSSIRRDIGKRFKSKKLIQILEFPVLFLGAKPQDTPAFYNFMNYADLVLGTWYPVGGMYSVVQGIVSLGEELGVEYHTSSNIEEIITNKNKAVGVKVNGEIVEHDIILSGADYHHTETLLNESERSYSEKYWSKKTFAPSALLYYIGLDKKLKNLSHHTLFFDRDFDDHAIEIYDKPSWPKEPLFYASFSSMTDKSIAPEGKEAATFLIPLAPGLEDNESLREDALNKIIDRLEKNTDQKIREHILFKRSYCVNDFKRDYNSYKGNAYGMANTLTQTAFLRPGIISKKVKGLYFTGQLTVPGPGVPPALISGKIASDLIIKEQLKKKHHEINI